MTDEMLMMRPDPRSNMCGNTAWLRKNAPERLTASTTEPVLVGELEHCAVDRDARVVDEDVQAAVLFEDLVDRPPAIPRRADVCPGARSRSRRAHGARPHMPARRRGHG